MDGDRQALLEASEPIYTTLNADYNVTHFYFHTLEKTCFLRIHQPGRFGDAIDRYTLASAARLDRPYYGLELGPLGTFTLRYVRPWRVDGKLIGYVELGEEIEHITGDLQEIMNVDVVAVIDKSFVNRAGWQQGQTMLGREDNWDLLEDGVIIYELIRDDAD